MTKTDNTFGEERPHQQCEAFENLRQINRELLVASMAEIPEKAAGALQTARENVLSAIREIAQRQPTHASPPEEWPVKPFRARLEEAGRKFEPLFAALTRRHAPERLPSKLNRRRNRRSYGCL